MINCPVCKSDTVLLIAGRCVGCPGPNHNEPERHPIVYTIDDDPKKYTAEEFLELLNKRANERR